MAGGKGKSGGKSSGGKTGADGSKKQQSHSSKAGLQVSRIDAMICALSASNEAIRTPSRASATPSTPPVASATIKLPSSDKATTRQTATGWTKEMPACCSIAQTSSQRPHPSITTSCDTCDFATASSFTRLHERAEIVHFASQNNLRPTGQR